MLERYIFCYSVLHRVCGKGLDLFSLTFFFQLVAFGVLIFVSFHDVWFLVRYTPFLDSLVGEFDALVEPIRMRSQRQLVQTGSRNRSRPIYPRSAIIELSHKLSCVSCLLSARHLIPPVYRVV